MGGRNSNICPASALAGTSVAVAFNGHLSRADAGNPLGTDRPVSGHGLHSVSLVASNKFEDADQIFPSSDASICHPYAAPYHRGIGDGSAGSEVGFFFPTSFSFRTFSGSLSGPSARLHSYLFFARVAAVGWICATGWKVLRSVCGAFWGWQPSNRFVIPLKQSAIS